MSAKSQQEKCNIEYNDTNLTRKCPYDKGHKVASLGCKICNHCYGEYTAFSVYCGYDLDRL